jgi:hypothetical protein
MLALFRLPIKKKRALHARWYRQAGLTQPDFAGPRAEKMLIAVEKIFSGVRLVALSQL